MGETHEKWKFLPPVGNAPFKSLKLALSACWRSRYARMKANIGRSNVREPFPDFPDSADNFR